MASFDENGKYIKTNWKAGDKITATKLNKIEESIEAVNDNDISRHVEADARLDALEAKDVAHDKELTNVKRLIADNKATAELGDYEINSRMQFLEQELNEGIEEVHNVAETVDGKIAQAVTNVNNVASTVDEKIAQGKADMEAMVAEMENEIDNIYYVKPEMFEGDDTTKIRNALSSGKNVLLTASSYTLNSSIDVPIGVDIKAYKNVVIYPATTAQFNLKGNNVIDGLTIDGQNDQYIGLQIQGSNITIKNCTIKNLLYSSSYGIRDYGTDEEFFNNISIHDCEFDNISCIPNSVQGDGAGSCRAIALSHSRYINIYNNKFTNLQEYEDSDYVHIGSGQSIDTQEYPYCEFANYKNSNVYCNIYNNTFENFKKSAVKIQASSCKIYDNYFIANERTTMAMRGYSSENVEFINNKIQYNSPTDDTETVWMTSIWNFEYCKNLTVKNNIVTGDCGVFDYPFYFKYVADTIIQNNIIEMPNSRSRTTNSANSLCVFRLLGKNVNVINNKIHLAGSVTAYFIERATSLTDEMIFDYTIDSNRLDVPINYLFATHAKSSYPNTNITLNIYNDILVKNNYYISGLANASTFNQADVYMNQCEYDTAIFRVTGSNLIITNSVLYRVQIQDGIKTHISKCFFTPGYESITLNNPGELRISNCELDDGIYMFTAYRAYKTTDKVQIVNTTMPAQITYQGSVVPQSIDRLSMRSWAAIPSDILPSILCISHNGELEGYNYGANNLIPKFNVPINTKYYDTTNKKELRFNGTVWE